MSGIASQPEVIKISLHHAKALPEIESKLYTSGKLMASFDSDSTRITVGRYLMDDCGCGLALSRWVLVAGVAGLSVVSREPAWAWANNHINFSR